MKILIPVSTIAILLAFFAFSHHKEKSNPLYELDNAIIIDGDISAAILKISNGCGIGNFLIPLTGDPSQNIPPMLGTLSDNWQENFKVLDTIPGTHIKGIAFKREFWTENTSIIHAGSSQYPYVVISDSGMFSYLIPYDFSPWSDDVTRINSLLIPDIIKMADQITTDKTEPIVLFVKDSVDNYSLRFYDYPELQEQFSFPFYFEPEIFEVSEDALFITGLDTSGNYMLYHFSAVQDTLFGTYTLNDAASNALEVLNIGDSLFVLSAPGDSITMLSTIDLTDGTLSQSVVYPQSGARATYNDFKNNQYFTFQPIADPSGFGLDKQILILDPVINQLDTFLVDFELDYFKQPTNENQGFGFYQLNWIGAKWEDGISDTVYFGQYNEALKVNTEAFPQYINATYGCWVSVNENELEKIQFEFYPNPASSEIIINLIGLNKDRQYHLEVVDHSGRIHHTTSLRAYQKINLPLQKFAKGIYFLKLDTGKNIITKKLIIQ